MKFLPIIERSVDFMLQFFAICRYYRLFNALFVDLWMKERAL